MPASLEDVGTVFEADAMATHRRHKDARSNSNEVSLGAEGQLLSPVLPARAVVPVKEMHYGAHIEI